MDVMQTSDSSDHGIVENSPFRIPLKHAGGGQLGNSWYFSRKEIEENSQSRRDGIDLKKESYLRKSYCTFLQDLGMRLKCLRLLLPWLQFSVIGFSFVNLMPKMTDGLYVLGWES